jgi:site-specific DNA-methyltransferase (adenine-specific)
MKDADAALGTNGMAGHYFGASQWSLPTWEAYVRLAEYAALRGPARDRPYLVHPSQWPVGGLRASHDHLRASHDHLRVEYDHLRVEYDHLRAEYDHLRAEYEASRPPFTCPLGVGNVWTQGAVSGSERLRTAKGVTLHPCQKPLLFAERMIRASTRPGDTVWVPFGGTLREMVAAERMARGKPSEARRVISCELNADGVDYIGPAIAQAQGLPAQTTGQADLFGSTP